MATGSRHKADGSEQPTLRDLLAIIPGLVSELGYNDEISSTIRAGLVTRLSSLSLGAKGLMLNSGHSIPFDNLLAKPTILEMAAIGNEEEKAFLLGAVLVRLAQYRQHQGTTDGKLRHLLLIEEAHRLLSAVPSQAALRLPPSRFATMFAVSMQLSQFCTPKRNSATASVRETCRMRQVESKWSSLRHAISETNFMLPESNHVLRVHRFLPETEVEGPGRRAALWVQGCPIQCPGCANGATWSFDGGKMATVESVFDQIQAQRNIEGVTFIGGEPFSQGNALAALGRLCQKHGLSVVTFTGYEYARLIAASRPDWNALLEVTDLLLAGPFVESQKDFSRPWVGSRNQEFVFLTDRYRHLQAQGVPLKNGLEILIAPSGSIRLNGLAPVEDISAMRRELASLGLNTN